ncbi:hypothetical protein SRCM100623_00622 [Acetobacter pasteurianus]|uniref:Ribbon-helix-helix protein CopG domain-containing protein n=1 Tax=Acetobacter pasteurianus TaxID=438 RepID=A0A1A0DGS2_ACEPA|nr:hypothetical protein [Acetobacter pasteurianus]OAZ74488.1 hypothetical protein SRCM100623_00622 [Acetobacter pasteurianus]
MSKKPTASSFLDVMKRQQEPATKAVKPVKNTRAGLKHIGGYLDADTVEKVAILRARLKLDNSQLIKRAIEELFERENAARKFGDR